MKKRMLLSLTMLTLNADGQTIVTNIDAKIASMLKPNKWVKVSETKAIYSIFFGAGSSSNRPNNPTLTMENNTIKVCGNVPYHTVVTKDYQMIPAIYVEMDLKKNPDYAKIPVIYKQNTIESYPGMQADLQMMEEQVYFKSAGVETYNAEKHRKAITHFITNFKFKGTKYFKSLFIL